MKKNIFILCFIIFIVLTHSFVYADPFTKKADFFKPTLRSSSAAPMWLIKQQGLIRENIALVMSRIKDSKNSTGVFSLLFLSFIYGLFHAAGPGHRKSVVFAFFIAKKAAWLEPLVLGLLLALLHAGASVLLVTGVSLFTRQVFSTSNQASMITEYIAYFVLFILALFLLIHKLYQIIKQTNNAKNNLTRERGKLATVFLSGIFPCPGATLILIFSLVNNMLLLGILAVIAMSLGMGIIISIAGYLAVFGQKGVFYMLKNRADKIERTGDILEIIGLGILVLFAGYMLFPFL